MDKVVKLFAEESTIVFTKGTVIKGSTDVGGYMMRVINSSVTYGVNRGLKIGFVGGVLVTTGVGVATYKYYKSKNSK